MSKYVRCNGLTAVKNVLEVWPVHDFQQGYVVVFLSVESNDEEDVFVKVLENSQLGGVDGGTQPLDLLGDVVVVELDVRLAQRLSPTWRHHVCKSNGVKKDN